jgi:hypothetical protein
MSRATLGVLVAAIVSLMPAAAFSAYMPLLVDNGAAVFDDSFDTGAVGSPLSPTEPNISTWNLAAVSPGSGIATATIVDSTSGVTPNQGSKMLKGECSWNANIWELKGTSAASAANNSDVVTMNVAYRQDAGSSYMYVQALNPGGDALMTVLLGGDSAPYDGLPNNVFHIGSDATYVHTSWNSPTNQWSNLSLSHTNGTTDWSMILNGTTYSWTGPSNDTTGNYNWTNLNLSLGASSSGYFDAMSVPEPASVTLLGLGASGLLAYAWRRRK